MKPTVYSRVIFGFALLSLVLALGTAGYVFLEGWPLADAIFMTVTTITTVGFREVRPLDTSGQILTMLLLFIGVGTAFYILTAFVAVIIEGDLTVLFGERKRRTNIERLSKHFIICGFGRVGEEVSRELSEHNVDFVIVDKDEDALERARATGALTIQGDASAEDLLLKSGIKRARALVAVADSDAVNTFITLTARVLNPDIFIVARVSTQAVESKLKQAGANRVISPYAIGGRRIALAAVQPIMTDYIDIVTDGTHEDRILAEFTIDEASGLIGRSLTETLAACKDVVPLALRGADGKLMVGPAGSTVLSMGDRLMVVGDEDELRTVGSLSSGVG